MRIFTTTFWADASERALKTISQSVLALWVVGDQAFNALTVDWRQAIGIAIGAGLVSILTSITSATITSTDSASLSVKTSPRG